MELTYEELKAKFIEELTPELKKSFLESDELQELLKAHHSKEVLPTDTVKGEPVPFAQSAKLIRALARKDYATANKIQMEEIEKYAYDFGMDTKNAVDVYMTETSNEQGLYLCPIEWYKEIFRLVQTYGIARRDCRIIPMTTKIMRINTIATMPNSYWIDAQVNLAYRKKTVTKPHFGQIELKPVIQAAITPWEDELLADATPNLVQLITELTVETFSRGEDDALFNGNGGFGIVGILANLGVHVVPMGGGDIAFANIDCDDLSNMITAVETMQATAGAKFYLHPEILNHVRLLKEGGTGAYIWQKPSGTAPGTIWNYPYEVSSVMPGNAASAVNTPFVIFGNLKRTVLFADRQKMTIKLLTEASIDMGSGTPINLAQYNMSALRFNERLDIEVILPLGLSVLYTALV